ncbi:Nitroreductase family protein [Synechococcus sp. MIT S9504]|nr:Nitroreductase family protein [Synechococcus sp. MIT S9504]
MLSYRFRDGVQVDWGEDNVVITAPYATRLNSIRQSQRIDHPGDSLKSLLKDLVGTGVDRENLLILDNAFSNKTEHRELLSELDRFYTKGLLLTEISGLEGAAICLAPVKPLLHRKTAPEGIYRIKFSKFVIVQPWVDGLEIVSPLATGAVRLKDQRLFSILLQLVAACDEATIRGCLPDDLQSHYADVISLLLSSGVAGVCDGRGVADIDQDAVEAGWTFEDLAFHCHTREKMIDLCRNQARQTPIDKKQFPAKHQRIIRGSTALPLPSSVNHNLSFFQVVRERKTIRAYQEQPINAGLLSDFLWHSMHIREEISCDPGLSRAYAGLLKPVASAGALHSIELYLCINRCIGLQPGFYHFDSSDHSLGKLCDLIDPCLQMLELAAASTCRAPQAASVSPSQGQLPDVLVVMAARYGRNASLHQQTGLSYALILKDVGSIYQQLYLVATALGLAPCGLSFGSSELFHQASGHPGLLECSVGEFMIGNPPSNAWL